MISLEKIGLIALSHGWEREGTRCTRSQQVKWDDGEGELSGRFVLIFSFNTNLGTYMGHLSFDYGYCYENCIFGEWGDERGWDWVFLVHKTLQEEEVGRV